MNSITRLILHRVAAGNVKLTPQVIEVLKEVSDDATHRPLPEPARNEPIPPTNDVEKEKPPAKLRVGFANLLPGRRLYRMSCALLLMTGVLRAVASPDSFDAANEAFAQGKYAEAAHGYETVLVRQGFSAPALFNLANAQQRDGKLGHAILNYERAALLAPNDADITTNLNFARQKAGVETERYSLIQKIARSLTLNTWFVIAATAAFFVAVAVSFKQTRPGARWVLNLGNAIAGFALVVAIGALVLRGPDLRRGVVTAPEAVAGVSPVTVSSPVFKLRAGEIVTLKQAHGDFALIQNRAGHEGWVKAGDVTRIIPGQVAGKISGS